MPEISPLAILVVALVAVLLLSIRLSIMMARRAICAVIQIFHDKDATSFERARTPKELGLVYRPFTTFIRDYKPYAFQVLVSEGIVQMTFDDRFFLDEANLARADNIRCPVRVVGKAAKSYNPFSRRPSPAGKKPGYPAEDRFRP